MWLLSLLFHGVFSDFLFPNSYITGFARGVWRGFVTSCITSGRHFIHSSSEGSLKSSAKVEESLVKNSVIGGTVVEMEGMERL